VIGRRANRAPGGSGAPAAKGRRPLLLVLIGLALLSASATAAALTLRVGDIVVEAEGGFAPKALPKHENAPITLRGGGKLSTVSGELPPILKTITIDFDRHGSVVTTGLPHCTKAKLAATDTAQARRNCPGSIVGEGEGTAVIKFPEQPPIKASSPLTLFNGPPKHGNPTVLAHAHLSVPSPTTFVVSIVIEKIHQGVYGYRTEATIPKIAGGAGIPISGSLKIGRKWTYRGHHYSYVNARCETGHLQAQGEFTFNDGTSLSGTFLRVCKVR
jgi:hypothetical protein